MPFSRFQRRLILLTQFLHHMGKADKDSYLFGTGGIPKNKINRWWNGFKPSDIDRIRELIKKSNFLDSRLADMLTDEDTFPVYQFSELLGFDTQEARYIIDMHYHNTQPTLGLYVTSMDRAQMFMGIYGGAYLLYRIDYNEITKEKFGDEKILVRCPVVIRYPVPYSKDSLNLLKKGHAASPDGSLDKFHIRAKLSVPAYGWFGSSGGFYGIGNCHKYDGVVNLSFGENKCLFFVFEHRTTKIRFNHTDTITINLDSQPETDQETGLQYFRGVMLSLTQDKKRTTFLSSVVMIKRADVKTREDVGSITGYNFHTMIKDPGRAVTEENWEKFDESSFMSEAPRDFRVNEVKTIEDTLAARLLKTPWSRVNVLLNL
ncbi:hypothetical protein FBZ90_12621 [Nitrospirillum pindoramense]|uniref:Uncharacterized protein n=2 Tax=Nitrospirillum amazonense TaxID=28077 RepID=A0A560GKL9_9PROT|nr:hypothetical protein FBZ90_12621 [Nitrospirillum amazonense]